MDRLSVPIREEDAAKPIDIFREKSAMSVQIARDGRNASTLF